MLDGGAELTRVIAVYRELLAQKAIEDEILTTSYVESWSSLALDSRTRDIIFNVPFPQMTRAHAALNASLLAGKDIRDASR